MSHLETSRSSDVWRRLVSERPSPVRLSYRESPVPLRPWRMNGGGRVSVHDPPATLPGMVTVELDAAGRLRNFTAVAGEPGDGSGAPADLDPAMLFDYAGLNRADFVQADASAGSPGGLQVWTGTYPGQSDPPVRVEMIQDRGRLLHFKVAEPLVSTQPGATAGERGGAAFVTTLLVSILVGAGWLAAANVRRGRGDRRGALRLAVFVAGASMAAWLFSADHVATAEERLLLTQAVREALFQAGLVWLLYLALEPYVRRRWPHTLIAWSRLLDGRFRDPVVARDVLVGLTGALLLHVFLTTLTVWDRDAAVGMIAGQSLLPLSSLNRFAGWLVESLLFVEVAMGLFFLMVVARAVLRNDWLAAAILLLLVAVPGVLMRQPLLTFAGTIIYPATLYVLSVRVGLLALAIAGWMGHMLSLPLTTDANAWHAGYGYVLIAIPVLLGFIAFVYAKAGRPLGRIDLLQ